MKVLVSNCYRTRVVNTGSLPPFSKNTVEQLISEGTPVSECFMVFRVEDVRPTAEVSFKKIGDEVLVAVRKNGNNAWTAIGTTLEGEIMHALINHVPPRIFPLEKQFLITGNCLRLTTSVLIQGSACDVSEGTAPDAALVHVPLANLSLGLSGEDRWTPCATEKLLGFRNGTAYFLLLKEGVETRAVPVALTGSSGRVLAFPWIRTLLTSRRGSPPVRFALELLDEIERDLALNERSSVPAVITGCSWRLAVLDAQNQQELA